MIFLAGGLMCCSWSLFLHLKLNRWCLWFSFLWFYPINLVLAMKATEPTLSSVYLESLLWSPCTNFEFYEIWLPSSLFPFHFDLKINYWLERVNSVGGSLPFSFKEGYKKQCVNLVMVFQVMESWFIIISLLFTPYERSFCFCQNSNFDSWICLVFKKIFNWGTSSLILPMTVSF